MNRFYSPWNLSYKNCLKKCFSLISNITHFDHHDFMLICIQQKGWHVMETHTWIVLKKNRPMVIDVTTQKYFKTNSNCNGKEETFVYFLLYFLVLKNKKRKRKSGSYVAIIIKRDNESVIKSISLCNQRTDNKITYLEMKKIIFVCSRMDHIFLSFFDKQLW